jgi:hypothetical protein
MIQASNTLEEQETVGKGQIHFRFFYCELMKELEVCKRKMPNTLLYFLLSLISLKIPHIC